MNETQFLWAMLAVAILALWALLRPRVRREDIDSLAKTLGDAEDRSAQAVHDHLRAELSALREASDTAARQDRDELGRALDRLAHGLADQVSRLGTSQGERLDGFAQLLNRQTQSIDSRFDKLRETVEARLGAIQADNAAKLETMRQTVDEKLHATLEQRLGDSFKLVSDRLEQVHRGLGEMQTLAAGVGDLKKVLTNVKTRGSWGEVQLGALLEQILTPAQYAVNVATRPQSNDRVEFALRLPGQGEFPVWLPIDAKFPIEDYQKLLEAQERADPVGAESAAKALENRLKVEARTIRDKYVEPPHTTDFALLYLPIEGLYAEALRRPGLAELLQREFRVTLAGPTTLAALLNSLQMGFRTLAIEQRSSEVWAVLGAIKTEFGKFGESLAHTRKKLEEASNSIGKAETRNRVLTRKLERVEALPVAGLLDDAGDEAADGDH